LETVAATQEFSNIPADVVQTLRSKLTLIEISQLPQTYSTPSTSVSTYDHRTLKTRLPVRSALFKQRTGGLVVRWVTTSEYPLLYVFDSFFAVSNDSSASSYMDAV
jgi:hypothetical protein